MKFFFTLICIGICLVLSKFSKATSKHMICKPIDDDYNKESDVIDDVPVIIRRSNQGTPGKRGSKGEKGDRGQLGVKGEPGTAGVVDYEKINDTIKELISSVERSFTAKIESLEERLLMKINDIAIMPEAAACTGFMHNEHCFWAEIHSVYDTQYNEAVEICARNSGKTADITDDQQYNAVFDYVRSNMPSAINVVNMWLAMTVTPSSKQVQLSNGIQAPYLKYLPGYPLSTSSFTQIGIEVQKDSADKNQGMFNYSPDRNLMGVVCQK